MKPVDQQIMHDPDNGQYGDCFRAVIASLMELPPDQVPHFCDFPDSEPDKIRHHRHVNQWLEQFGLAYLNINMSGIPDENWWQGSIYHELSGTTERGTYHSVVAHNGIIVHDPHPSKAGLIIKWPMEFGFIVARCNRSGSWG